MTGWLVFFVLGSIIVYFACFWFFTWYSVESIDYGILNELFTFAETYLTLFFFTCSYILVDSGLIYAGMEINAIMDRRKERALIEAKLKAMANPNKGAAITRRLTKMESKFVHLPLTYLNLSLIFFQTVDLLSLERLAMMY